jgi:hypothetical protein
VLKRCLKGGHRVKIGVKRVISGSRMVCSGEGLFSGMGEDRENVCMGQNRGENGHFSV